MEHGDNISIRVVHLPHRGGASTTTNNMRLFNNVLSRSINNRSQGLHNDAVSALNYLIYVGSTTTAETILPNTPNDSTLYLYSFILAPSGSAIWSRYHRRAGYVELEPSSGQQQVPPTADWGYLNSIIMGPSTTILSFIRDSSWQASHIIDFNLVSSPQHVHIASIISMAQHPNIRQRLRNWLQQFHPSVFNEFFEPTGNLRNKWAAESTASSIMGTAGATTAATTGHQNETTAAAAAAAAAASASATASPSASSTGTSITINNFQPESSFVIKFRKYNDDNEADVQMQENNDS